MKYMLDLETLGKGANAPIVQIGLAFWSGEEDVAGIRWNVRPGSYSQPDIDTTEWWIKRVSEGTAYPFGNLPLREGLDEIMRLMKAYPATELWARSPSFDCVILRAAFEAYGMREPWHFRDERDMRTLQALVPDLTYIPAVKAHDALEDARAQAKWTIRALKRIKQ